MSMRWPPRKNGLRVRPRALDPRPRFTRLPLTVELPVERGGAVCSTDLGTEVRLRVVARRTLIELEGPWRVVPAVYCVYRADTTLFHRHRRG